MRNIFRWSTNGGYEAKLRADGRTVRLRKPDDAPNPELEELPVAWFKLCRTGPARTPRVFQATMGSGDDFRNTGLRRLVINAAYWGGWAWSHRSPPRARVDVVGTYEPLATGFDYV